MGKMLLGGFAISVGFAGLLGGTSSSPNAALSAASVVQKQRLQEARRNIYVTQMAEDGATEEQSQQQPQTSR